MKTWPRSLNGSSRERESGRLLQPGGLFSLFQGVKALALSLTCNTSVLKLNLSDNGVEEDGAAAVAEMLKENCFISGPFLLNNGPFWFGCKSVGVRFQFAAKPCLSVRISGSFLACFLRPMTGFFFLQNLDSFGRGGLPLAAHEVNDGAAAGLDVDSSDLLDEGGFGARVQGG